MQTRDEKQGRLRRVLYVTDLHPSLKFGSLDELIFVLARAFRERGGLFLPVFGAPLEGEAAARYDAAGLPAESLNLYGFAPARLRQLLRLVRRHSIELIDWNFYSPFNPYLLSLSALAPAVEHYYTDHNSRPSEQNGSGGGGLKRAAKKVLLRRYRKVLCISDFLAGYLERQRVWPDLSRCRFFINTDRFRPDGDIRASLRKEHGVEGRFVLLTVANLNPGKGVAVMIRALAELPTEATLWVVGDGPEAAPLRALSNELGVADRVRFFGRQRDVSPYMKAADCFICPSIEAEAMGFVNLEALACQLPVVASDIGGIPELVNDGATGFLFRPGDHHQLADKINRLIGDPDAHARMAAAARRAAVENFSVESRLPDYLDLYRLAAAK